MNNKKVARQSGIELLRIYAIMSVIVLHYFNAGIGGGTNYLHGTLSVFTGRMFLTLTFCAVDLFIMISGYFLSTNNKRSLSKTVFLIFEAAVLRTAFYIINAFTSHSPEKITVAGILTNIVSLGYFIVFYSIIYLISPLINIGFNRLDKKNCQKAVITLFIIFSVISSILAILNSYEVFGNDWNKNSTVTNSGSFEGYTIVNFFLCYIIGGYIRHWHSQKIKASKLLLYFSINTVLLLAWSYFDWLSAFTYDNPFVIFEAALLILLFKDMKFKSKLINELATSGFTCYLVHIFFLKYIGIEKYASQNWYVLIAHVIVSVIGIYLICYVIHKVYSFCFGWISKLLSSRIDKISLTVYDKCEE